MYSPFHPVSRGPHNVLHLLTRQAIGDLIRKIFFLWEIGNRALLKKLIENLAPAKRNYVGACVLRSERNGANKAIRFNPQSPSATSSPRGWASLSALLLFRSLDRKQ